MKKTNKLMILVCIASISGCASTTGWTPTVETYGDVNAGRLNIDMHECEVIANQSAGGVKDTLTGAGIGGLIGGAGGAAIGAVLGAPAEGAALGAGAAGILGGTYAGIKSDDKYKSAYTQCIRGRGHKVY